MWGARKGALCGVLFGFLKKIKKNKKKKSLNILSMAFSDYEWLLGCAFAFLGSICSNFGVNIQKYSFMLNEAKVKDEQKAYYKQIEWIFGLLLVIIGSLGDFVGLALAPESIISPISSVTLVTNIFFAYFWLKEELSIYDFIGTLFIIGGSVLAVLFGDHASHSYDLQELLKYYSSTSFKIYAICCFIFVLIAYILLRKIEPKKLRIISLTCEYDLALINNNLKAMAMLDNEIDLAEQAYEPYIKLHPLCYCIISGTMGGQNILFGKMVAELIETTIKGDNQLIYFMFYFFTICMLTSIFLQLHFLAKALQYFDAMYVVPVFTCFFISVSTIAGAAYFQEFATFSFKQIMLFVIGILITLSGVYVLSARKMLKKSQRLDTATIMISQQIRRPTGYNPNKIQPKLINDPNSNTFNPANKNNTLDQTGMGKFGLIALDEEDHSDYNYDEIYGTVGRTSISSYKAARTNSIGAVAAENDRLLIDTQIQSDANELILEQGFSLTNTGETLIVPDHNTDKLQSVEEVIVLTGNGRGYVVYVPLLADKKQREQILKEARDRYEKNLVETQEQIQKQQQNVKHYEEQKKTVVVDPNQSPQQQQDFNKPTEDIKNHKHNTTQTPRNKRSYSAGINNSNEKQIEKPIPNYPQTITKSKYARMRANSSSQQKKEELNHKVINMMI